MSAIKAATNSVPRRMFIEVNSLSEPVHQYLVQEWYKVYMVTVNGNPKCIQISWEKY